MIDRPVRDQEGGVPVPPEPVERLGMSRVPLGPLPRVVGHLLPSRRPKPGEPVGGLAADPLLAGLEEPQHRLSFARPSGQCSQ